MQTLNAGKSVHFVWNDFHRPYHDAKAVKCAEAIASYVQPDYIHYNGDIIDFYALSKFDKKPRKIADLQNDLDDIDSMFRYHRTLFKKAKMYYHLGNHEDRLRRYLWTVAKELSELRCLELPELLGLNRYEINMVDYEEGLKINDTFVIQHGDIVSAHSSYTAKRMYEKHGGCGIHGHTHRGGVHYKNDYEKLKGWWENWCLCDLNPDYVKNPNWQQGISIIYFSESKQFFVEPVPIIEGKAIYGGKIFEA